VENGRVTDLVTAEINEETGHRGGAFWTGALIDLTLILIM
jgi:hypothetical protein